MVEVSKYIRKLLFEQDCVIIPDFGGLLVHQVQASYDSTLRRFQPARKRVAFNEVLRLDDGLLSFHLATQLSISREQAVQLLRGYTDQIKSELRNHGTFVLEGVGHFTRNHEGKLVFEPTQEQNFHSDWFGLMAFDSLTLQKPDEVAGLFAFEAEEAQEVIEEPVLSKKKSGASLGWLRWVAAASVFIIAAWGILMLPTTSNSEQGTLNPFHFLASFKMGEYATSAPSEEVSRVEKTLPAVIVSPIEPEVTLTPSASDTSQELSLPTSQSAHETAASSEPVNNKRVHIVAGGFTTRANARKYIRELSSLGISDAYIIEEQNSRLIKVSVGGFPSRKQANAALIDLKAIYGEGLWIYTAI